MLELPEGSILWPRKPRVIVRPRPVRVGVTGLARVAVSNSIEWAGDV